MPKRVIMTRVLRDGQQPDGEFDVAFWAQIAPEARLAAAWDCVLDLVRMGRLDESGLRLRRDVVRVERRGR